MGKVKLNIFGLSYKQTQIGVYVLILTEEEGSRRIPIIIGSAEAQAIAIELEGLEPPRPLTHDLFKNLAFAFSIHIIEVYIYKLDEGVFYSRLVCKKGNDTVRIDSRTSDAVALALRFNCPIFTSEEIIEKSGVTLNVEEFEDSKDSFLDEIEELFEKSKPDSLKTYSSSELQDMLHVAIENEDYEKASQIRDELNSRIPF